MTDKQLDAIWKKHLAGESLGDGLKAREVDGVKEIATATKGWRKGPKDHGWNEVPNIHDSGM